MVLVCAGRFRLSACSSDMAEPARGEAFGGRRNRTVHVLGLCTRVLIGFLIGEVVCNVTANIDLVSASRVWESSGWGVRVTEVGQDLFAGRFNAG